MEEIRTYLDQELNGTHPNAFKMDYDLVAGEILVATLRFRSIWGSLATAESADGCWTFKRVGFFQTHVTIRACNLETDLAIFRNNTWIGGGSLILSDGRKYLASTNFWATQYDFKTENEEVLVHYQSKGFLQPSIQITFQPAAWQVAELPWITLLGWYLIIMMQNDSAAAGAAAAGGAVS